MKAKSRLQSPLAMLGMLLGVVVVILSVLGPVGYAAGWWVFRGGFTLLRWAIWISPAALMVSLVALLLSRKEAARRGMVLSALGIVLIVGFYIMVGPTLWRGRTLPSIHDITTDTEHPPAYVAVLSMRQGAENPPEYAGAEVAAKQKEAYADLAPALVDLPTAPVYQAALDTAKGMGWEIVAAVPQEGRIEAVDTSLWYKFKDDVVIRIQANGGGSRVDVRSLSRVGRGDFGVNAKRIRAYLSLLHQKLKA